MINVAKIDKNNNRDHWTESEWNTLVCMTGKIEGTSLQIEAGIRNVSEGMSFLISKQLLSSCKRFVGIPLLALL